MFSPHAKLSFRALLRTRERQGQCSSYCPIVVEVKKKRGKKGVPSLSVDSVYGQALEPVVTTPVVVAPESVEL
jgi:hypothetical protein